MMTLYGIDEGWGDQPPKLDSVVVEKETAKTYRLKNAGRAFGYALVIDKNDPRAAKTPDEAWTAYRTHVEHTIADLEERIGRYKTKLAACPVQP